MIVNLGNTFSRYYNYSELNQLNITDQSKNIDTFKGGLIIPSCIHLNPV